MELDVPISALREGGFRFKLQPHWKKVLMLLFKNWIIDS